MQLESDQLSMDAGLCVMLIVSVLKNDEDPGRNWPLVVLCPVNTMVLGPAPCARPTHPLMWIIVSHSLISRTTMNELGEDDPASLTGSMYSAHTTAIHALSASGDSCGETPNLSYSPKMF